MIDRKSRRGLSESELRRKIAREKNKKEVAQPKVAPTKESSEFHNTGIKIKNLRDEIVVTIPKNFIGKLNTFDLANHIGLLTSPLFLQKDEQLKSSTYKAKSVSGLPNVGVFMNNVNHYSGGRYYAVMFCKLLANIGCNVTMVTDRAPFFIDDFKNIDDGGRLQYRYDVDKSIWCSMDKENTFDLVVGVPANTRGFDYAKKWNIPIHMMVFETPNYVSQYRGGLDSGEGYWADYKKCLAECDKIICLANTPMEKAQEWLKEYNVGKKRFTYLYPAVNSYAADDVADQQEGDEVAFIGRHTDFKNPVHIVKAAARMKDIPAINFVGAHSERTRILLSETARKLGVKINFYANINDADKFKIIKRSKAICVPTIFEGFGIPPAEALYCGKASVAYDIPVLKEVYKEHIDYAPAGNISVLAAKLETILRDDVYRSEKAQEGRKYINQVCHPSAMKRKIRESLLGQKYLEISVGMIVLNSADTIEYSLKSIYNSVKEILIVEGAVKDYAAANPGMINEFGGSVDDTVKIISEFPDPLDKIKILSLSKMYDSKMVMQNIIAENVSGDIYLKVDADEVYKESDIERIRNEFIVDPELTIFRYKFNHFWHGLDKIAVGGQWESKMTRCWRWDKSFRHPEGTATGFNVYFDGDSDLVDRPKYKIKEVDDRIVYHLNYAVQDPKKIKAKINYYKNRGIEKGVKDTWSNWKEGDKTSPTHAGGTVQPFEGELPYVLSAKKCSKKVKEKIDHNMTIMESPSHIKVKEKNLWTVGMIALNEDQFIEQNIRNLLLWDNLIRIVVVEGTDRRYSTASSSGLSVDKTSTILEKLANENDRIYYVRKGYVDNKQQLRNEYLKYAIGRNLLVVDADEFYTQDDLNKLDKEVERSPKETLQWEFQRDSLSKSVYGGIVHFWHSVKHRVVGGYYSIPHQRIYHIVDGMKYDDSHNHPCLPDGTRFDQLRNRWGKTSITCYHAGFMKDVANMRAKQDYYYNRGEKTERAMYSETRELWFNWDGKTLEYPEHKVKILPYNGYVPDALMECCNV